MIVADRDANPSSAANAGAGHRAGTKVQPLRAGGKRRGVRAHLLSRDNVLVVLGWISVFVGVSAAWQFAATHGIINPVFTGLPSRIGNEFVKAIIGPALSSDARATVTAALIGAGVASVLGIASAFVLAQSDVWRRIFDPYFTVLNGLPRVALAPLFLLWFGIGPMSKIMLAASITYFVTFYNTMVGVDSVDRDHLLLARALGASRLQVFLKFVVPSAVPSIFNGLQLGFVYGMLGTVASEMLAGERGLGVLLTRQAALFQMDDYFATLMLLALATTAISGTMEFVRRRLLRWQRAHVVKV
ncbi:MAG TPA: ABC transporter permease [Casimicrobiaceae bacterium]|nr:ABC transporter permease [Casimicrobiaceae bacterium]